MAKIAIDFDGVIHAYGKGWHDGSIYDGPVDGTKEAMTRLKAEGHELIIFSTRNYDRTNHEGGFEGNQVEEMRAWLATYEIPYDSIWTEVGKPMVTVYLDDRGLRFSNWDKAVVDLNQILDK